MWYTLKDFHLKIIEQGISFIRRASQIFHVLLSSLFNHLIGWTQSKKMGPPGMLTEEEDATIYEWILVMGDCSLSISLNQLKLRVAEMN